MLGSISAFFRLADMERISSDQLIMLAAWTAIVLFVAFAMWVTASLVIEMGKSTDRDR